MARESSVTVRSRSGSLRASARAARYCFSASASAPRRWKISARPRMAARFSGAPARTTLELGLRLVELIDLDEGASERDTG